MDEPVTITIPADSGPQIWYADGGLTLRLDHPTYLPSRDMNERDLLLASALLGFSLTRVREALTGELSA
jgi:hypothetical protein